jgi:hypothetical protein
MTLDCECSDPIQRYVVHRALVLELGRNHASRCGVIGASSKNFRPTVCTVRFDVIGT